MTDEREILPEAFMEKMRRLLGSEYGAFAASYSQGRQYGLRRNLQKGTEQDFIRVMPFPLEKISWAREGYYYDAANQPGRHVLHEAGAYYIQEPSAMAAVEALDPVPGERILDLCAAPGGKSTQIAGRMEGQGLLVANEVIGDRAKILSQNVERMGITNCVVCAEKPERMALLFPGFFDRILVDAPCSGEGMFRKEEAARQEWSSEAVQMCADRQALILEEAAKMLKPGGVLVYSTSTLSPEENEGTISAFLQRHEEYSIEEIVCKDLFSPGRAEWIGQPAPGIEHTLRLWPHLLRGEGHYVARLRKKSMGTAGASWENIDRERDEKGAKKRAVRERASDVELCKLAADFLTEELGLEAGWLESRTGQLVRFGEQIYLMPEGMISLSGVKVLRPGLHLMTEKKNRFEPAHALALSLDPQKVRRTKILTEQEARAYLRGESVACQEERGWILLVYEGYPLGFGKASGGQIKNQYPKGLRKTL